MLGSRGIWHQGWKAVTEHGPMAGSSSFADDRWQLFHTDEDRSEAHDVSADHPDRLTELADLWMSEAKANNVLPLNDLQIIGNPKDFETFIAMEFKVPVPPSGQYTYYPGTTEVPERSAANVHNVSYKVLADVELTGDSRGVIFAHGSRFGGHALLREGRQGHLRLQLPGHPARGPHLRAGAHGRTAHHRRRVREGTDGGAPRGRRTAAARTSTTSWSASRRSGP